MFRRAVRIILFTTLTTLLAVVLLAGAGIARARHVQVADRQASSPTGGIYVDAYDSRIFVQRMGRSDAPVVVFLSGTGGWSEMWRRYMTQVAGMGYQAIAFDMPPFGYSIPPPSGDYSKAGQARRILAALDSLGIQRASFVAHSFGSAPLMEMLLNHPDRADRVVLVSPALGLDQPPPDGSESWPYRLLSQRWFGEPLSAAVLTNPHYTGPIVKYFVTEKGKVTEDWVDLYRRQFKLSDSYQSVAAWVPQLFTRRTALKCDNPESYMHIAFPVTLIWGDNDPVTPLSQAEHLRGWIPGSRLLILPGGHVPMVEEPDRFGEYLRLSLTNSPS